MKQLLKVALVLLAALTLTLTSCRPPELETAVMEYNKKRYETAKEHALEATEKYPEKAEGWWIYGSSTMEIAKNYDDYVDGNAALDKAKKINEITYVYFNSCLTTCLLFGLYFSKWFLYVHLKYFHCLTSCTLLGGALQYGICSFL